MNKKVLLCEDSFEGILSGVYDAWIVLNKVGSDNVGLSCNAAYNIELFCEYIPVKKNREYAFKVAESIRKKISVRAYEDMYMTAMAASADKADIIFRYLQQGFKRGSRVSECLGLSEVMEVTRLSGRVRREYDHLRGFLRFEEVRNKVLWSDIKPENDVIELLGNHFTDRLPQENFLIRDVGRKKTLVHKAYCDYYITDGLTKPAVSDEIHVTDGSDVRDRIHVTDRSDAVGSFDTIDRSNISDESCEQEDYEALWKVFVDTIAIETRKNDKLQKNNLPLRFRTYMTEFENRISSLEV